MFIKLTFTLIYFCRSRIISKILSSEIDRDQKQQNSSKRNCTVCKKKPIQVQCLHCAEHVCLECAQQHVNSVAQESDGALHLLNEKLDNLDRIAVNTRQRIVAERDKIVQQADAERDRSFTSLAQMIEEEKQKIRNKSKEINELPLNEIPLFIRQLQSEIHLTGKDDSLFGVNSSMPQIFVQRRNEQINTKISTGKSALRSKFDESDDEYSEIQRSKTEGKDQKKVNQTNWSRSKYDDDDDDDRLSKAKPRSKRSTYGNQD